IDAGDGDGPFSLVGGLQVDLPEISAGELRQEREALDGHVRLVLQALLLNLAGHHILRHDPCRGIYRDEQRDDDDQRDRIPPGAAAAGARPAHAARGYAGHRGSLIRSMLRHRPGFPARPGAAASPSARRVIAGHPTTRPTIRDLDLSLYSGQMTTNSQGH